MLEQFPFRIRGLHSDNGSEFLAEAKNGAVVRKHMGYTHIAEPHAAAIEVFYERYFNPYYLNFHRPCGVPEQLSTLRERAAECTDGMRRHGKYRAAVTGPRMPLERGGDDRGTGAKGGSPDGHAGG
jgi:hypothetical protein